MTEISIIIVNFNTRDSLEACLASVPAAVGQLSKEVIVVDNASTDGSVAWIQAQHPTVILLANAANLGFSAGVNLGLGCAHGRFLLVLNPDIVLEPGSLEQLVAYLQAHPETGAIMPVLLGTDGSIQREYVRKLPSLGQVLLFCTFLEPWAGKRPKLVARFRDDAKRNGIIREVEQIPGAFVLTSRRVLDLVGGFDERFKLFFEDVDWSLRVQQAGYKLVLHGGVSALHAGGSSMKGVVGDWMRGRFLLSLMTYYDLHSGWLPALLVKAIIVLNSVAVVLARTVQLLFSQNRRDQRRSGQQQHLYLLRIAAETYLLHRSVPLIPSPQPPPVAKRDTVHVGG